MSDCKWPTVKPPALEAQGQMDTATLPAPTPQRLVGGPCGARGGAVSCPRRSAARVGARSSENGEARVAMVTVGIRVWAPWLPADFCLQPFLLPGPRPHPPGAEGRGGQGGA